MDVKSTLKKYTYFTLQPSRPDKEKKITKIRASQNNTVP